jgi:hypothetical protein
MTTTTVTVAGHSCQADRYQADANIERWTHWIDGGRGLDDTITTRVTALIHNQLGANISAGLPTRDIVDAAMRVQRMIDAHWRLMQIIYDGGHITFLGPRTHFDQIAGAVEDLLTDLPNLVLTALKP